MVAIGTLNSVDFSEFLSFPAATCFPPETMSVVLRNPLPLSSLDGRAVTFFRSRQIGGMLAFFAITLATTGNLRAETAARVTINSNSGTLGSSSTNTSGAFQVANLSTGGVKITSLTINTATAMLPDIVFDPAGTAGDPDGKAFQLDSFSGSGTPVHSFESPHDGVGSEDGYEVLRVTCGPSVDFGPGDSMTFSADIDPTSVKGAAGPGPEHSASISGLEMIGATVTVTFSDGTVRTVRTAGVTGSSNTNKMSMALLASDNLATPGISVPGKSSPFTTSTQPTVRVSGPAGASGKVWVFSAALYLAGVPGGGYDIDPYEVNKVIAYGFSDVTIGASGFADVPLSLEWSASTGGIHFVSAVLLNGSLRSSSSDILVIDYDPGGGSSLDGVKPTVPLDLAATAVSAGSVTLGWSPATDNVAVTGYRVVRNGTPVGTTSQLSFTDGGRTPSTAYNYAVEAYDAAGNDSDPSVLAVTTPADTQAPTIPGAVSGLPGDGSAALSWTGSTDNVAVTGYRFYRANTPLTTVATPGFSDGGLVNGTAYLYAVTAIDAAGNESAATSVTVTPEEGGVAGAAVLRVNAGSGGAFVDPQGNAWSADFGFNSGTASSYTNAITGTANPLLYQSRRTVSSSVPLLYDFDLANGNYRVVLHFVEVSTSFGVGSRVFDLVAEDILRVDNLDIFGRVGSFTACVVEFPVTVSDGRLNLSFPKVASNPTISGIEVFQVLPPVVPPTFEQWLAARGLTGMTAVDSDFGGLDNLAEYELQLDPNDAADDATFRLHCEMVPGGCLVKLPPLKPLGNYHLHRGTDLAGLANPVNRIATISRSAIEAMSPEQRAAYGVNDTGPGPRAFYQLHFEPVAD